RALIELAYGRGKEFEVKFHQGLLTLTVPERAKFDFAWLAAKPRVVDRLRSHLKPKSIHIVEEYATPEPEPERGPAKPAAGSEHASKDKPAEAPPAKA
ncbi:MAG: hypothetical protein L3J93_05250, partial [Thermoplasmata archaeon]|nr:hypothetical protein [Thermoplasmata archaeon]